MRFSLASTIGLASLAASAYAASCAPDTLYCGSTLVAIGDYMPRIAQHLVDKNLAGVHDNPNTSNWLFKCKGGQYGVIEFYKDCGAKTCKREDTADDHCS